MLRLKVGRDFGAVAAAMMVMAAAAPAMGDAGGNGGPATLGPTSGNSPYERIEGRCRFEGTFSDSGKGDSFSLRCRSRLRFELRELLGADVRSEHDRMEIECDGSDIYSGPVRVFVEQDHATAPDRDPGHRRDVIFKGVGSPNAPSIFVSDLSVSNHVHGPLWSESSGTDEVGDYDHDDDHDHDRNRATLRFSQGGYSYMLRGECRFERGSGPETR
jgi:hypothetical protein